MISNIFRRLCVTLTFAHNNHCYHYYCYHDRDNNAFGFNKCFFGIISGFQKNRVPKFQLTILRVEKVFCIKQYRLKELKLINKDLAQK